ETNLAALRLALELQADERDATADERQVLAGWTSWGAVPQIFDERDERFQSEREQLRELLTQQEYNAARRTILNAHYTANDYVDPMWEAMLH
ncbi:hypothetical protein NL479_27610, partial [Klebsiella pneumoniae]|nr:hypothetical protein [Klebsiella pneumoniae]